MFKIDNTKLGRGLEEALRYHINLIEDLTNQDVNPARVSVFQELRKQYSALSDIARDLGVATRDYDLTCSRLVERFQAGENVK